MRAPVEVRLLWHKNEVAAQRARLVDHHDGLHAAGFRFAGAGDDAGSRAALIRHDANRAAAKARIAQLLYRREKPVKIEI